MDSTVQTTLKTNTEQHLGAQGLPRPYVSKYSITFHIDAVILLLDTFLKCLSGVFSAAVMDLMPCANRYVCDAGVTMHAVE